MDNTHTSTAQDSNVDDRGGFPQLLLNAAYSPLRLLLSFLSSIFSALRPYAPQIIPALICLFLVPLVIIVSLYAGFVVWQNVAVGWESPVHLQFGDGAPPYAYTILPKLIAQQRYDISVHLTIPATHSNFALGNFMTTVTLSTPSNKTLTSVRRPAIVFPPRHSFLRRKPNTINLALPVLSSFLPGTSSVVAFIEVGRRDGWTSLGHGQGREISVISASIQGTVVHHGIRGLVARFPLIFALISTISFLVILSFILAACILPTVLRHVSQGVIASPTRQRMLDEPPLPPLSSSSSETEEKPPKKPRSRPRSSTRSTRRTGFRAEAPVSTITQMNVKPDPLRRRTSRLSDSEL